MKILPSKYACALADALEETNNPSETIRHFLDLLRRRKAFKFLSKILHAFEKEWHRRKSITELDLYAPEKFAASASRVAEFLQKKSAQKVISRFHADDSLIGGVKVIYEDTLIDATVRHRLAILARTLYA